MTPAGAVRVVADQCKCSNCTNVYKEHSNQVSSLANEVPHTERSSLQSGVLRKMVLCTAFPGTAPLL